MGKDKYENEELIKYAFPIDVWFHVENLSSAHVYLRLPEEFTIDTIPQEILSECLQIVKDNSKDGRKKEKVSVCYTLWENLFKTSSMDVGEVGFKDSTQVKIVNGVTKNPDLLKILKKTLEEKEINLELEKESYKKEVDNKKKKYYEEQRKQNIEEAKKMKELKKEKSFGFIEDLGQATSNKVFI
jgi:hypothetical protein